MSDMRRDYERSKKLMSFASEISFPGSQGAFEANIQSLLDSLLHHFGYSAASFWTLNSDLSLSDPIGFNLDEQQLEDYMSWRHEYDILYPKKFVKNDTPPDSTLFECTSVNHYDVTNPYHQFLMSRNLYHADSLFLKSGKEAWSVALFKSFSRRALTNENETGALRIAVPMIAGQVGFYKILSEQTKAAEALKYAAKDSRTSIIMVDLKHNFHITFSNPVSREYASDFVPSGIKGDDIETYFVRFLFSTYMEKIPGILELSLSLESNSSRQYHIRIKRDASNDEMVIVTEPLFETSMKGNALKELLKQLTPTEQKVSMLIAQGFSNQEIAEKMYISLSTVKTHINHIFQKVNVANRTSLMAKMGGSGTDI